MNLFQKYMLTLVVFSLCTLAVILITAGVFSLCTLLITAGVFLTVLTVTAGAVMYYPLAAVEWLAHKMRRVNK